MQMGDNREGLNILIPEKILQRTANPTINAQTFKFSPLPGAKEAINILRLVKQATKGHSGCNAGGVATSTLVAVRQSKQVASVKLESPRL